MAVDAGMVEMVAGGGYIRFHSYVTDDSMAEVLEPGYFNSVPRLQLFDRIEVTASANGEREHFRLVVAEVTHQPTRIRVEKL